MADYTFYTVAMSRGWISRWALHEVGANYKDVLMEWATRPESFTKLNPMNKVPTLVHHHGDHDHVVTEAAAINHYLAETHPEEGLLPDSHEKASYFRWLFFAAGPIEQTVVAKALDWEVPEDRQGMAGFGSFDRATSTIDGWLGDHDFVTGERFTMADTYVGSQLDWGLRFGTIPETPSIKAYVERCTQRTAYQEAAEINARLVEEAGD